jgi:glucose-1-phosphate thymidylyltransferase
MDQSTTVIILAAGFGKRTQGILKNTPKTLIITKDGKTILDHTIEDLTYNCKIKNVYIVTNNRHYQTISDYVKKFTQINIVVINDGRNTPEERMGSLGDLLFAYRTIKNKTENYLILPSDYAYWQAFSLKGFMDFSSQYPQDFCLIGYDVEKKEIIKNRFGCIVLDTNKTVVKFIEKPENPPSSLAASAFYMYRKSHLKILKNFIKEGNNGDSPGMFIPYLLNYKTIIKAFVVPYSLIDAGTPNDIERAKVY